MGVDHADNGVVVDLGVVPGDGFSNHDALFHRFVRQHRAAHQVADGVDAFDIGAALFVNDDKTTLILSHTAAFGQQALSVWTTANSDNQFVKFGSLFTVFVLIGHGDDTVVDFGAGDFRAQTNIQTLFGQNFLRVFGDLFVNHRQEGIQRFQYDNVSTQTAPDRTQFQTDDTGADHTQTLGYGGESQCAGRIDDNVVGQRSNRNVDRGGTSRQNH